MYAFFDEVQLASSLAFDGARSFFTIFSLLFILSNILIRRRNHKPHPPRTLYHYTLFSRLLAIQESGYIKGGHHGVVFTTGTRGFKNKGTGKNKRGGKKVESNPTARIVFRGDALKLFKKPARSLTPLLTGRALFSDMNDEYITIQRGNLKLLDYRLFGKTLLVTAAEFAIPPLTERMYMRINGFLLHRIKNILSSFQYMTLLFWLDYFYPLVWFRLNWIIVLPVVVTLTVVWLLMAESLYLIFRNRVGLQ